MAGGRARVAVSILDADHSNMAHAIRRAESEGADRFHIDVMDGHFVPNLTFGPAMVKGIRPRTELPLDAHLMITDPLQYVDEFLEAGCDSITFHVEVDPAQIEPTLLAIRSAGRAAGLAVKPKTPLSALEPYRELLDIVLVMTVEPGFGGQMFMKDVAAEKILAARDYLSHKPVGAEVHVDGGVNRESAEFVGGLGVDILVVGSVLWIKGRDMGREIRLVRALADEGYQYGLNNGKPPIPRDAMVTFAQLPKHLAWRFMGEIEAGGIPVIPLRGTGRFNPDGVRDYDLLVPASAEALTLEGHAADRARYLEEADRWRDAYIAEHGVRPPDTQRPGMDEGDGIADGAGDVSSAARPAARSAGD
jgi:ribulose-phosphate 3-epimerase